MKLKSFIKGAKIVGAMAVVAGLTGCGSVIDEGNFAIEKHWGGSYNDTAISQGFHFNIVDTIFQVYGRESLVKIEDVRPKDSNKILLKDLDLNISFKANKEGAIKFLLKTGDMTKDGDLFYLGRKYVQKDAQSIIGRTVGKFTSEEMLGDQQKLETTFKTDLQKELDELYGKDTFTVTEVKIANIRVADAVEEKIQAVAMVNAEQEKNKAIQKVLESRQETLTKEASTIRNAADKGGLSVDQLLQYEMIKVMKEGNSEKVNIQVNAKPSK